MAALCRYPHAGKQIHTVHNAARHFVVGRSCVTLVSMLLTFPTAPPLAIFCSPPMPLSLPSCTPPVPPPAPLLHPSFYPSCTPPACTPSCKLFILLLRPCWDDHTHPLQLAFKLYKAVDMCMQQREVCRKCTVSLSTHERPQQLIVGRGGG